MKKEFNLMTHPLSLVADLETWEPESLYPDSYDVMRVQLFTYQRPGDGNHDSYTAVEPDSLVSCALKLWKKLQPGEELGITSRVDVSADIASGPMYIPMIDFAANCPQPNASFICAELEKKWPGMTLSLYSTGRSFHAYGNRLLCRPEWYKWLSHLLRVEPLGFTGRAIDVRWVGFSLERGHSALRLSANGEESLAVPTLAERIAPFWDDGAVELARPYEAQTLPEAYPAATVASVDFGQGHNYGF